MKSSACMITWRSDGRKPLCAVRRNSGDQPNYLLTSDSVFVFLYSVFQGTQTILKAYKTNERIENSYAYCHVLIHLSTTLLNPIPVPQFSSLSADKRYIPGLVRRS